jgi:acetylglutamate kinase
MPLVRTPMIAPTQIYKNVPTLAPEEAADMIAQACIFKPVRIATRLGVTGQVMHAFVPRVAQIVMNTSFRMFPHIQPRDRAEILAQALPYIRKFHGKTMVIKYGGNAMTDPALQPTLPKTWCCSSWWASTRWWCTAVARRSRPAQAPGQEGRVHPGHARDRPRDHGGGGVGAGRRGAAGHRGPDQPRRRQGGGPDRARRRHDPRPQAAHGGPADPSKEHDVGQVGDIVSIDPSVVKALQDDQFIPVVSPIGFGEHNESYNINADVVAAKLATVLQAEKLLMLTNIPACSTRTASC